MKTIRLFMNRQKSSIDSFRSINDTWLGHCQTFQFQVCIMINFYVKKSQFNVKNLVF